MHSLRRFIDIVLNEADLPWKSVLKDGWEIAKYITSTASDYVDEEFIAEHYRGDRAVLTMVPISELQPGDADHNLHNKAKERRYTKLALETMPPLVVENGQIMDGNHRYRVAVK